MKPGLAPSPECGLRKKNLREVKIRPAVRGREIGPAMLESEGDTAV